MYIVHYHALYVCTYVEEVEVESTTQTDGRTDRKPVGTDDLLRRAQIIPKLGKHTNTREITLDQVL